MSTILIPWVTIQFVLTHLVFVETFVLVMVIVEFIGNFDAC